MSRFISFIVALLAAISASFAQTPTITVGNQASIKWTLLGEDWRGSNLATQLAATSSDRPTAIQVRLSASVSYDVSEDRQSLSGLNLRGLIAAAKLSVGADQRVERAVVSFRPTGFLAVGKNAAGELVEIPLSWDKPYVESALVCKGTLLRIEGVPDSNLRSILALFSRGTQYESEHQGPNPADVLRDRVYARFITDATAKVMQAFGSPKVATTFPAGRAAKYLFRGVVGDGTRIVLATTPEFAPKVGDRVKIPIFLRGSERMEIIQGSVVSCGEEVTVRLDQRFPEGAQPHPLQPVTFTGK